MVKTYSALKQYQSINTEANVAEADPHRLIQMLMEGTLEKIGKAKAFMMQNQIAQKSDHISWAISIINGLKDSLDNEQGGEIAANLDKLYTTMIHRLTEANVKNDPALLDEVMHLMSEIKSGWDGIREEALKLQRSRQGVSQIPSE